MSGQSSLRSAQASLARLAEAVDEVADVDRDAEDVRAVGAAVVALAQQANKLAAQQVRNLAAVDGRDAIAADGAVTVASWYRNRVNGDHATAARMVSAASRLASLPHLREALEQGAVTLAHVTAVTSAAVPTGSRRSPPPTRR